MSAGAFDGHSTTGISSLIGAGRVQVNFWDPEPGYYLNSTYYGEKNILAIGLAGQTQAESGNAYSADFLMERKVAARRRNSRSRVGALRRPRRLRPALRDE